MSSIGDQCERVRENSEDDFENDKDKIQRDADREGGPEAPRRMGVFAAVTRRMVVQAHLRICRHSRIVLNRTTGKSAEVRLPDAQQGGTR